MESRSTVILLAMLACFVMAVHANTEIVKFTAGQSTFGGQHEKEAAMKQIRIRDLVNDPQTWPRLLSPHMLIRRETLQPSYSREEDLVHRLKENPSSSEDYWKNREIKWYVLGELDQGAGYELRVSYPSTSPADFIMKVWTLAEAQEYWQGSGNNAIDLAAHFPSDTTMLASIKAIYTGVSYQHGPESLPIPYNLVLERLYFAVVPFQALKLALAIAVVVVVGFVVLIPKIHRYLIYVAATGAEPESSSVAGKRTKYD
ncbi:hypothetical protein BGZ73_008540 [Actinomortierella ambigua]|nr:hypothetical protein BGZ73_008540 [Actinomortierella ambigua]